MGHGWNQWRCVLGCCRAPTACMASMACRYRFVMSGVVPCHLRACTSALKHADDSFFQVPLHHPSAHGMTCAWCMHACAGRPHSTHCA